MGPGKKGTSCGTEKKATRNTTRHGGITSALSEEGMLSSTLLLRAIVSPRGCVKLVQAARGVPKKFSYYLIGTTGINSDLVWAVCILLFHIWMPRYNQG